MSSGPLKILVVDLSSLFRMNWEASQGKELSAAFTRTIEAINAGRVGFDRVIIACDSGRSFRVAIDPAYKANREDPGEPYREQLRRTVERLRCDGCVIIQAPRIASEIDALNHRPLYAEADDVIGTIAALYRAHVSTLSEEARDGWWLTIYSGDGDMEQLVDDEMGIDVAKPPFLGGGIFDATKVLEKRGVPPENLVQVKALMGDKSDNFKPFPGLLMGPAPVNEGDPPQKRGPGIGDGAAVKLVSIFGSALAVFDDLDRKDSDGEPLIKPHLRKLLDTHGRAAALKGLALATIKADLPIDWSLVMSEPKQTPIIPDADFETAIEGDAPATSPASAPAVAPPAQPVTSTAPVVPPELAKPVEVPAPTALARRPDEPATGISVYGLQPQNMAQLYRFSQMIVNSGAYPQFGKPEAAMAAIADAMERGVPAMAALRGTYIVKGRMAHSASYMAALVLASGKSEYFEIVESTMDHATLAYKRVGRPGGTFVFTIEEARAAGWCRSGQNGDSKWITNPRTMLRWAALREGARAFFFDVVQNMYTPDEVGGKASDEDFANEAA